MAYRAERADCHRAACTNTGSKCALVYEWEERNERLLLTLKHSILSQSEKRRNIDYADRARDFRSCT